MTREEALQHIVEHGKEYLKPDKRTINSSGGSYTGYICPVCGSGGGSNGTGITENKKSPNHFTCWRGCFENEDIIGIIGKEYRLSSFNEQFDKACYLFGITPDEYGGTFAVEPRHERVKQSGHVSPTVIQTCDEADFTVFLKEAAKHIEETDYHRGISLQTLKRFDIGYVSAWRHPKAMSNVPTSPRLIIPNSEGYLARDTRKDLTEDQKKYTKQRVGHVGLFNADVLKQATAPIWVTEGEFDALSIIDAGGQAVALCSTTNAGKLIDAVKAERPKVPLIIALDNDMAGQKAKTVLAEGFKHVNFSFYRHYEIPNQYKDVNEFLMADREGFAEWIKIGTAEAYEKSTTEREAFEHESAAYALNDLLGLIKANKERQAMPTGFRNLDSLLDGGLWPGLYTVGAMSATGKTTLVLQIADYLAQLGHGVLILSLEMARSELLAKSLSRLTLIKCMKKHGNTKFAKTTRGVLRGYFSPVEHELLIDAVDEYEKFGQNIYIVEGMMDLGTDIIRKKAEEYIRFRGNAPVILIDYLQALAAPKGKYSLTDKQITDINIVELKRISRDYATPVLTISSFNRDNYLKPVNMAAFKESGAIEYSSDVVIGLQYYGWDYLDTEKGEKDAARAARLRLIQKKNKEAGKALKAQDIQIKVLKNRNGTEGDCRLDFWPAFNFLREGQDD